MILNFKTLNLKKMEKINYFQLLIVVAILLSMYIAIDTSLFIYSYDFSSPTVSFPALTVFQEYILGNLGKTIAVIGFIGTFLVYSMTHKGAVLVFGIIVSLIAGGMVGISSIFFSAGQASFEMSSLLLSTGIFA